MAISSKIYNYILNRLMFSINIKSLNYVQLSKIIKWILKYCKNHRYYEKYIPE